jgi:hypothetical protein
VTSLGLEEMKAQLEIDPVSEDFSKFVKYCFVINNEFKNNDGFKIEIKRFDKTLNRYILFTKSELSNPYYFNMVPYSYGSNSQKMDISIHSGFNKILYSPQNYPKLSLLKDLGDTLSKYKDFNVALLIETPVSTLNDLNKALEKSAKSILDGVCLGGRSYVSGAYKILQIYNPEILDLDYESVFNKNGFSNDYPALEILNVQTLKNDSRLVIARRTDYVSKFFLFKIDTSFEHYYNYCDPGSYFITNFFGKSSNYRDTMSYAYRWQNEPNLRAMLERLAPCSQEVKYDDLKDISSINKFIPENTEVITLETLDRARKREAREEERKSKEKSAIKLKTEKYEKFLENLSDDSPKSLAEMEIYKSYIKYQTQVLRSDLITPKEILSYLIFKTARTLNYDEYFNLFIEGISKNLIENKKADNVTIGDINLTLSEKGYRYFINDIRINKNEIEEILRRASCFTKVDDYNNLLNRVNSCSLRISDYLNKGITAQVYSLIRDKNMDINIPMVRKDNKNYLRIQNKYYKIKDTNNLIKRLEGNNRVAWREKDRISVLLDSKFIEPIPMKDIAPLIKEGKARIDNAREKSKKLLDKVCKQFNIEYKEKAFQDKNGFIVEGKKDTYFVEFNPHTDKGGKVYRVSTGNYVCIVDKTPDKQAGVDNVVNRIFALKNDSVMASNIRTL